MSTATRRKIHINSLEAFAAGRVELFSKREREILSLFRRGPGTDRDVMTELGFADMNSVRPRITELIKDGVLAEIGSIRDSSTGKLVRVVNIRSTVASNQTELALGGVS